MSDPFVVSAGFVPTAHSGTTPVAIAAANTDVVVLPANPSRQYLCVANNSSAPLFLTFDGSPAVSGGVLVGVPVAANGGVFISDARVSTAAIHAASSIANPAYYLLEG